MSYEQLVFGEPWRGLQDGKGGSRKTQGAKWGQGKSPISPQEAEGVLQGLGRFK